MECPVFEAQEGGQGCKPGLGWTRTCPWVAGVGRPLRGCGGAAPSTCLLRLRSAPTAELGAPGGGGAAPWGRVAERE